MRFQMTNLPTYLPVLALAACVACGEATGPSAARRGETFTLSVGETALLDGAGLLVGLTAVAADSRCPTDVQCVTAGDAAVELWLRRPPADRESRTVHTDPALGRTAEYGGFEVELVSLRPQPTSDRPIDPGAYLAELVVR